MQASLAKLNREEGGEGGEGGEVGEGGEEEEGRCVKCGDEVRGEGIAMRGEEGEKLTYHPGCFTCSGCCEVLEGKFYSMDGGVSVDTKQISVTVNSQRKQ